MSDLLAFHAFIAPRILLGPLYRVYVDETSIVAAHIGHQLNDPLSGKAAAQAARYDTARLQGQSLLPHDSRNFEIRADQVTGITLDLNHTSKAPLAPGTIKITQHSADPVELTLVQSADPDSVSHILSSYFNNFVIVSKSESANWRTPVAIAILFSLATIFFVWYGCQRVEHLPVLVAVPPNIYGIFVCIRTAVRRRAVSAHADGA